MSHCSKLYGNFLSIVVKYNILDEKSLVLFFFFLLFFMKPPEPICFSLEEVKYASKILS